MRAAHGRVEHASGNVRDDELRLVLADHAHDVSPQLQVRRQVAVLVAEELDPLDAQHLAAARCSRCRIDTSSESFWLGSSPPCDPSVTITYVTLAPSFASFAIEPPAPNSG